MTRRRRYRNYKQEMRKAIPWLIAAAVAFFVMLTNVFHYGQPEIEVLEDWDVSNQEVREETSSPTQIEPEQTVFYFVDVAGAVVNPGVVQLAAGSRVYQALEAAGGLSTDGDTREVNLAALLSDGQKIYIPSKSETESQVLSSGKAAVSSYIPNDAKANNAAGSAVSGKVNINTEDTSELMKLSGVGPTMAERILDYRREHGNFAAIEELKKVKGIGDKTFEKLKDSIYVP